MKSAISRFVIAVSFLLSDILDPDFVNAYAEVTLSLVSSFILYHILHVFARWNDVRVK